jgi:ATP-binding cassette subfamily B protein
MKPIRALGRLMAYRPILYSIDCALWIMVHAALLIPGLLAKAFFDSLPTEAGGVAPSAPSSLFVIALMLAFALARVLHIYLSAAVDIVHRFTMSSLLRANAFAATFDAPGASPLPASPSESLDYLKVDAEQVEDAISWTLDVIGSFAFSAIALATLFAIDPIVTALAFVPLVVVVAIAQAAESKVSRYREAARSSSERATGAIGEAFQAVQAIKVAGAEEGALRHLAELGEDRAVFPASRFHLPQHRRHRHRHHPARRREPRFWRPIQPRRLFPLHLLPGLRQRLHLLLGRLPGALPTDEGVARAPRQAVRRRGR